ncbi:MAG: aminopeptidase P family protein [Candidatus Andersenbacteria bacterium]|nr:aminopeptidase P family protein [Candidatus Andersenbacteria bacterium]
MKTADLLIDDKGPQIRHRSGIVAPDPFIYLFPAGGKPMVFFDAREYDVKKAELARLKNGVAIKRLEPYMKRVKNTDVPPLTAVLLLILVNANIKKVRIPATMPYGLVKTLKENGLIIEIHNFDGEREKKSVEELKNIITAQRVTESAFNLAWNILAASRIQGKKMMFEREVLTSERLKIILKTHLLKSGLECPDGIIVASGKQTARPHDDGTGPILPNQLIIIDIFPRAEKTGYYADMTRTFVKGKASAEMKKLYEDLRQVQQEIAESVKVGDECQRVHQQTVAAFKKRGHKTSPQVGFMHGTGHSLGLSVHEEPRLNAQSNRTIEPGMVLTIEPGLYYPDLGGVRIEDIIVFHPNGRKENITTFVKPYIIS